VLIFGRKIILNYFGFFVKKHLTAKLFYDSIVYDMLPDNVNYHRYVYAQEIKKDVKNYFLHVR